MTSPTYDFLYLLTNGNLTRYSYLVNLTTGTPINVSGSEIYDSRRRPWYIDAASTGQITWSGIYVFAENPVLGITIASPYYVNNQLLGVFGVDIFLSYIDEFLSSQQYGKTGNAFMVDTSGYIIATSQGSSTNNGTRILCTDSVNSRIQVPSQFIFAQYQNFEFNLTQNTYFQVTINGDIYLCTLAPILGAYGLKWWLFIVVPRSDWYSSIDKSGYITIGIGVAITLIAILIAYFTASLVSRPLYFIKKGMEK